MPYRYKPHSPQWFRDRLGGEYFNSNQLNGVLKKTIKYFGGDYDSNCCPAENLDLYEVYWNQLLSGEKNKFLNRIGKNRQTELQSIIESEIEKEQKIYLFKSEPFKKIETILEKNNLTHDDLAAYIRWAKKNLKPKRKKKSESKIKVNSSFFKKPKKNFDF